MSATTQRRLPSGSSETAAGSRSGCINSPQSGRAARRRGASSASASRAATERTGLRATEDELAGAVVRLQALGERAQLREVDAGDDRLPVQGAGVVRRGRRRVLLRARAARGGDGRAARRCAAAGDRRAVGERQVLGAARRTAAGARRRRAARQRVLGARAAAPRRASAARPRARRSPRRVRAAGWSSRSTSSRRPSPAAATRPSARRSSRRSSRAPATRAGGPWCCVAVRADFYGRCASYPELWRLLGANQCPVGPMRRDELRRAIELPAQRAGLRVERDLVDALIADVEGAARRAAAAVGRAARAVAAARRAAPAPKHLPGGRRRAPRGREAGRARVRAA